MPKSFQKRFNLTLKNGKYIQYVFTNYKHLKLQRYFKVSTYFFIICNYYDNSPPYIKCLYMAQMSYKSYYDE